MKSINFNNSNLYLIGRSLDLNGNNVVKVHTPNRRAFSIQTNGVLPETQRLLDRFKPTQLTEAHLEAIEKEIVNYILKYGSETQKSRLVIYKTAQNKFNTSNGETFIDLFEDYENIPESVQSVLDKYSEEFGVDYGGMDYSDTANMHKEIESVGYTFDSGLDNIPYGLRPIGVSINQIQGFEDDEFAKGGTANKPLSDNELTHIGSDYAYVTSSDYDRAVNNILDPEYTPNLLPKYIAKIKEWEAENNASVRFSGKTYSELYPMFAGGGKAVSIPMPTYAELTRGNQFVFDPSDNDRIVIYLEHGIYQVNGFLKDEKFWESFETFTLAKKFFLDQCKQALNMKLAKGGKALSKFEKLPKNRQADKKYDYFAVGISDGKIVDGWEIIDDIESLKFYAKQDLKDNDYDPKDFRILSKEHIIRGGINPFDFDNWRKTRAFKTGGEIKDWEQLHDQLYFNWDENEEFPTKVFYSRDSNTFKSINEETGTEFWKPKTITPEIKAQITEYTGIKDVLLEDTFIAGFVEKINTPQFKEGGTAGDTNAHGNIDGNKANPEDFVLIKTESSHTGDTVIFVVRKSELAKIPHFTNTEPIKNAKTVEMQADQFLAMHEVLSDNRYDLIEVVTDPVKVREYLKGYNHTDYRIKLSDNTEDFYFGFVVYANRGKLKDSFLEGGGVSDINHENLEYFLSFNDEDTYWDWINAEITDVQAIERMEVLGFEYDPAETYYKGGTVEENLIKELQKLQRELNSNRLSTYIEGDNSAEEISRQAERKTKHDRFHEILSLLNKNNNNLKNKYND